MIHSPSDPTPIRFKVTIRDIISWTITVSANDVIEAEANALDLMNDPTKRSDFDLDEDTTVQVEEAAISDGGALCA